MSITIKQAFEKLAMVTGAAVKNPWFVGRNLNQAFADIADNVVDAGGDKVTVTQTVTSGIEIASIKVNDDTTKLYTPDLYPLDIYDEDEHLVARWFHDNIAEDVYERTIIKENLHFDNSMAIIDSSITTSTVKDIIGFDGSVVTADKSGYTSLCGLPGMNLWVFGIHVNVNGLGLYGSAASAMEGGKAICTIRYTKPTT